MKIIPFDVKYRSEIESGVYHLQTRGGDDARIISWDKKDKNFKIVALINIEDNYEICRLYHIDGTRYESKESSDDLVILVTELELNPFEKALADALYIEFAGNFVTVEAAQHFAKEHSEHLSSLIH